MRRGAIEIPDQDLKLRKIGTAFGRNPVAFTRVLKLISFISAPSTSSDKVRAFRSPARSTLISMAGTQDRRFLERLADDCIGTGNPPARSRCTP